MPADRAAIPRLRSNSPLGHIPAMRADMLDLQMRIARAGGVMITRLGVLDSVWLSSPAALTEVLIDRAEDFEKTPVLRVILRPLIGDGILSSQGSTHKRRRAIMAPGFQAGRIGQYADAIMRITDGVLDDMLRHERVDVGEVMMHLTLDAVCATLFNSAVAGDVAAVGKAVTLASAAATDMLRSPVPALFPPSRLTRAGRTLLAASAELDTIIYRIIRERRASGQDPGDVLSMLLGARLAEVGEGLSDVELRDEVMTLFLAGHETTANALTWALQLIATHPDVAEELEREVDSVLGDRAPTVADLPRLPYALAVFKESMRLYPPAYVVGRRALIDTSVGGFHIPRGQLFFCNIYAVQRDPAIFEEPAAFRPRRFMDGSEKRWPRGAYIPFSVGPRVCVGNHFALMEGQLVLARFAQRLSLARSVARVAAPEPLMTMRPATSVSLAVRARVPLARPVAQGA